MNDYRLNITGFLLLLIAISISSCSTPKDSTSDIKPLITSKSYIFKAQTALPMGGSVVQLTSPYDLRVSRDSVVAYLPYYGRAYNIDPYSSEGGIKFTSTKFNYKVNEAKKGGYQVTIVPTDQRDVRQLYLTVYPSGNASLQVSSNNRQPITFEGFVSAK
ncbi:MAG: DUF4251 domain-containing protein [Candidatus Dadabacteria bacterium]